MNKTIYKFRIWALSPVHIGSGQEFDLTSAYFDQKNMTIVHFDPFDFSQSLSGEQRHILTTQIINKKKDPIEMLRGLQDFISRVAPTMKIRKRTVAIPESLRGHFLERLKSRQLNQFAMKRGAFDESLQQLYIPGSSVKGALRTVWIEHLIKERSIKNEFRNSAVLESFILGGKFQEDPFRELRVSDFFSDSKPIQNRIYYARERDRDKNNTSSTENQIYQLLETIEVGAYFEAKLHLEKTTSIKNHLNIIKLLEYSNERHNKLIEEEKNFWHNILVQDYTVLKNLDSLKQNIKKISSNNKDPQVYLLRIGNHSGAEAVTVEGYRKIKIRSKHGAQIKDRPTTFWFAANDRESIASARPFGWVALQLLSEEKYGRS